MSRYEILIDGEPLKAAGSMIEITVLQDVSAPGMFALQMTNEAQGGVARSDMDLFEPGGKVGISMGAKGNLLSVMAGEITGLEPDFRGDEVRTVTVRGYDRRHRLMRGRKTRAFTRMKDSDIAVQVAREAGLTSKVDDTGVTLDYVMQHNQTDLEFLQARAGRLGFEVAVEGENLEFRKHLEAASAVLTLSFEKSLKEFCPRLSTIGLVGEVVVQGWSAKDKEVITGRASAGDLKRMGDKSGLAAADKAFKAAQDVLVDQPVQSRDEARQIALGRLREMALTYITGDGVADLDPALKAGMVVNIQGYGERFDGPYYLTSVRHTCSSKDGYRTAFTVQRNAAT